jgi:DNA polymerase V
MSTSSSPNSSHALVATAVREARQEKEVSRPLYESRVPAGFPSPADDNVEASLDLSEELIGKEEATFFVRVAGDSMTEAGIHDGDILVVDRSIEPEDGSVVVAALDGELTVKRYAVHSGHPYLIPEADGYDPIPIRDGQELVVWGVVRHVVHKVS